MDKQHYIKVEKQTSYHEVYLHCSMTKLCKIIAWFTDIHDAYRYAQQKAKELDVEYVEK